MKYLFILFFALTSNLSFASYHDGDSTNPAYDDGDSGYSSGSSAAIAIIVVDVLLLLWLFLQSVSMSFLIYKFSRFAVFAVVHH